MQAALALFTLTAALLPPTASHAWSNRGAASPQGVDRIRGDQWHLSFLRVAEAHKITQGEDVTVAVPDTGVHPHPDLAHNLRRGTDIVAGGSGDGRQDRDSHGTGMAGLIAAHGRAGQQGALGIAPKAKILPIRVKNNGQGGTSHQLKDAINYAITQNAKVISISAAGAADSRLHTAVEAAIRADIVIVAAAGNKPLSRHVGFPAAYPGVIAVGGVDRLGQRASVSVTGPEIDVVAPAVDIFSTSIDGKYRKGTGTSDSTAIVAGAVALIRSKYPYLPAAEVAHRLTATAIDKGPPGRDDEYGHGVIDLVAALTADVPPLGFGSATASVPAHTPSTTTAVAEPAGDGNGAATTRGLVTLGVIVAAVGAWTFIARRRRRGGDPPPRVSR
ncbi:type VII secretion-associated serine protease mycosin [Micromonospora sp. AMSO12t]|uniref:type VII secretion-associated serine protease mycosin n=1 Tax=Micromonospora sp. AMSO12t TaxID=2650410 RepID=UPI00351B6E04